MSKVPLLPSSLLDPSTSALVRRGFASDPTRVRQNLFKKGLAGGARQIGLWTGIRSTLVAEMLSHVSGMDWFVIDMEHSPNELADVLLQLQASQRGEAEPVVRVPWAEPVVIKRVLDLGAQSLIFPWINTAEEAKAAVEATRYPSLGGIRGVMSLARMNNYGAQNPHYYKEAGTQICNIMQIETLEAVQNIEAIASVDGVDALFVGPSDLSASMGFIGQPQHPEVKQLIEQAFSRIVATGKAAGFLTANKSDAKWALKCGCQFVAVGSDMQMLTAASKARWRLSVPGYGAFMGKIDVDKMDLVKYPGWVDVQWSYADLRPGDCLYIPFQWYHQVTAQKGRSINVHVWYWRPAAFDAASCDDKELQKTPLRGRCAKCEEHQGHLGKVKKGWKKPTKCKKVKKSDEF
ncbi:hpcH [Symbiodinium sp. CCMP2592]|nr:hpcH [Symbiodinium sp. CCMP2592]